MGDFEKGESVADIFVKVGVDGDSLFISSLPKLAC